MAKAEDEDTPPGWKWVLYTKYLEDKQIEVLSPELADRLGRKEIRENRLRYRYLDCDGNLHYGPYFYRDGNLHYDSLTDGFWHEAILSRETSAMAWHVPRRFYNYVEPSYEELGIEAERVVRIFRLEVLIPSNLAETSPKPTEAVQADPLIEEIESDSTAPPMGCSAADDAPAQPTKSSRRRSGGYQGAQRLRARAVLRRLFPERYPTEEEVSNPDAWDRFCREYERVEDKSSKPSKLSRPSRETMLREMGRLD